MPYAALPSDISAIASHTKSGVDSRGRIVGSPSPPSIQQLTVARGKTVRRLFGGFFDQVLAPAGEARTRPESKTGRSRGISMSGQNFISDEFAKGR